jgi:hypothetical protein
MVLYILYTWWRVGRRCLDHGGESHGTDEDGGQLVGAGGAGVLGDERGGGGGNVAGTGGG